jgi:hypothetical protein
MRPPNTNLLIKVLFITEKHTLKSNSLCLWPRLLIKARISPQRCMSYEQFGREFKPKKKMLHLRLFSLAGGKASVLILALSYFL